MFFKTTKQMSSQSFWVCKYIQNFNIILLAVVITIQYNLNSHLTEDKESSWLLDHSNVFNFITPICLYCWVWGFNFLSFFGMWASYFLRIVLSYTAEIFFKDYTWLMFYIILFYSLHKHTYMCTYHAGCGILEIK